MESPDTLDPLHSLLEHAEAERDRAQADHHAAVQASRAAAAQAEQLLRYRDDFHRRWQQRLRQSGAIELVRCHRDFTLRLDQAIEQQNQAAQQAEARAESARQRLVERERRVATVRKLIERRLEEAQQIDHRREQRATDEVAQRATAERATWA